VRNTYIYPPKPSLRIIQDIMGYTYAATSARMCVLRLTLNVPPVLSLCPGTTPFPSLATTCKKLELTASSNSRLPSPYVFCVVCAEST